MKYHVVPMTTSRVISFVLCHLCSNTNKTCAILESQHAQDVLSTIQEELARQEGAPDDDVTSLLYLLQSPLFNQLLQIQDSLTQLKEVHLFVINTKKSLFIKMCSILIAIEYLRKCYLAHGSAPAFMYYALINRASGYRLMKTRVSVQTIST